MAKTDARYSDGERVRVIADYHESPSGEGRYYRRTATVVRDARIEGRLDGDQVLVRPDGEEGRQIPVVVPMRIHAEIVALHELEDPAPGYEGAGSWWEPPEAENWPDEDPEDLGLRSPRTY